MYYPYLRGKQFELKALREFSASDIPRSNIVPIIEPVNINLEPLRVAIEEMKANNMKFALVLNPSDGDFSHTDGTDVSSRLRDIVGNYEGCIFAFVVNNDVRSITERIADIDFNNVMLVWTPTMDITQPNVQQLVTSTKVRYIVHDFSKSARRLKENLRRMGKDSILLSDNFTVRKRNADYIGHDDEEFTDLPFYYIEDGYSGFSDYTAISSQVDKGGSLPYAIAIHLTYRRNLEQIFIHHFVSDSNFSQSNIKGKFNEAASKIAPFYANRPHTNAVEDLISRAESMDGYPGLGYIKKLSILNHLELIANILQEERHESM